MAVAKLHPYKDPNTKRLRFRGKIGHKVISADAVSIFHPLKVGGRLFLRGKDTQGKIVWGFPYKDPTTNLLKARTLYAGSVCGTGCFGLPGCFTITIANLKNQLETCPAICAAPGFDVFNGSWVVNYQAARGTCVRPADWFILGHLITCQYAIMIDARSTIALDWDATIGRWFLFALVCSCCNTLGANFGIYAWRSTAVAQGTSPVGLALSYVGRSIVDGCAVATCTNQPLATASVSA